MTKIEELTRDAIFAIEDLADRGEINREHMCDCETLEEHGWGLVDMVCLNMQERDEVDGPQDVSRDEQHAVWLAVDAYLRAKAEQRDRDQYARDHAID